MRYTRTLLAFLFSAAAGSVAMSATIPNHAPLGEADDTLTSPSMVNRQVLPFSSPADKTLFKEIVPCHLVDTRAFMPLLVQDEKRTYEFYGIIPESDCYRKIPSTGVVALTLQVTSFNDGLQVGFLTFNSDYVPKTFSTLQSTTAFLFYDSGNKTVVQAGTVAITQGTTFTIWNRGGSTDFTIDILGYHLNDRLVGAEGAAGAKGAAGEVGSTGLTGLTGLTGPTGAQGIAGPIGLVGPTGPIGLAGAAGPQGPKGDVGLTGATGGQGVQGLKGDTGTVGAQGIAGPVGPIGLTGAAGAQGTKGDVGLTGAQGATGAAGANGAQGARGDQGIQGLVGPTGAAGSIGLAGATGAKGDTGAASTVAGPTGPTGHTGPAGAQGNPGAASTVPGPQGPQGPQGVQGPAGSCSCPWTCSNVCVPASAHLDARSPLWAKCSVTLGTNPGILNYVIDGTPVVYSHACGRPCAPETITIDKGSTYCFMSLPDPA